MQISKSLTLQTLLSVTKTTKANCSYKSLQQLSKSSQNETSYKTINLQSKSGVRHIKKGIFQKYHSSDSSEYYKDFQSKLLF